MDKYKWLIFNVFLKILLNLEVFLPIDIATQNKYPYTALQQDMFLSFSQPELITMQNFTETMNEQFKQFFDLQTKSPEPMRAFASLSADAVEQVARQNYAVAGDVLEYAVKNVNMPLTGDDLQGVASAQVAEATTFAELMGTRANEYAEMAQSFGDKAREATETAAASFK